MAAGRQQGKSQQKNEVSGGHGDGVSLPAGGCCSAWVDSSWLAWYALYGCVRGREARWDGFSYKQ